MQISCGVHPEISQEKYLRVDQKRTGTDHSGTRAAEGKHGRGGASDGGPRSYAVVDTTEVLGFRGGGVYKREECDRYRAQLHGSSEEFCRGRIFGRGGITCQQWGGMKPRFESTSERKRKKINGSIN